MPIFPRTTPLVSPRAYPIWGICTIVPSFVIRWRTRRRDCAAINLVVVVVVTTGFRDRRDETRRDERRGRDDIRCTFATRSDEAGLDVEEIVFASTDLSQECVRVGVVSFSVFYISLFPVFKIGDAFLRHVKKSVNIENQFFFSSSLH